ncbi:MAG: SpoIID/LytB domain-containing protein [Simkaniaceae bacterium]|nr:SpoIID/LytB domain-containing protein [Candidatus Sacchlamyda saccharinae]
MKKILILLLLFCSALIAEEKPVTVRVLLSKLAEEAQIEVQGRHLLYNPKTETFLSSSNKKIKARISSHEKGLQWNELIPHHQLRIVPDEKNCSILVNGIQYKGWIEIYNIGGTINIVNEVDAENYLKATLCPKLSTKLSKETLDSLVILERTNLYQHIEKDAYATWQLQADSVGYQGIAQSKAICDAIERTRDLVLHYKNKPFAASWGLDHAGRSVSYPAIFRKEVEVPAGVDNLPSLQAKTKSLWKSSISLQTLAQIAEQKQLTKIQLFRAEKSGKVYGLRLTGPDGAKDLDIQTFQNAVKLPSNDFTVAIRGKKAHFTGYGKGLGTGLCVASAEILAYRKASVEKILLTHFPGAKLINIRQESGKRPVTGFAWQ